MIKKIWKLKKEAFFIVLILCFLSAGFVLIWISSLKLPDLDTVSGRQISESTKIYDRTGSITLYDVHQNIKRTVVESDKISPFIKDAAVAIEDSDFYSHKGVKPRAFLRAAFANLLSGEYSQGGSTITQQVIKNSILTKEKSIARKIKEWILAIQLEKIASKEEILTLYLNESPYGGNIYGVEEASLAFFGKPAIEVNLAEAAYLAALPNAPTFYSPYGKNKEALDRRKNLVLEKMLKNNSINSEEFRDAKKEEVKFLPMDTTGIKAPHFVMYIKAILDKEYGVQRVQNEGFKVITSLDYELQTKAEEVARKYAYENEKNYNAENVGIVAVDVKTGEILTMVGSRDYFDNSIDGNFNIATAYRQPGSAFKPFVYASALSRGYTPETIVFDVKTEFSTFCNPDGSPIYEKDREKCYMPVNYDNLYRGPVTFKEALAQSINIPAIKVLYLTGIKNALFLAQAMGIKSLRDPSRYGLTLVLGGGEVSLLDITSAYTVFANQGVRNEYHGILSIENSKGEILFSAKSNPRVVLDKNVANQISDMLSDEEARAPSFGYNSPLHFSTYDVAAKTGTTNDYKDAWIVGYTTEVAVGSWAGNNNNRPMEKRVAGFIVAPMWNEFMREVIALYPPKKFDKPADYFGESLPPVLRGIWQGGIPIVLDKRTGERASDETPIEFREERFSGGVHSILHWINKENPRILKVGPKNDPQFNFWEYSVLRWAATNSAQYQIYQSPTASPIQNIPNVIDPSPSKPFVYFITPNPEDLLERDQPVYFSFGTLHHLPIVKAEYYVNGKKIGETIEPPFDFSFMPEQIVGIKNFNNMRVVVEDSNGVKNDVNSSFKINF